MLACGPVNPMLTDSAIGHLVMIYLPHRILHTLCCQNDNDIDDILSPRYCSGNHRNVYYQQTTSEPQHPLQLVALSNKLHYA